MQTVCRYCGKKLRWGDTCGFCRDLINNYITSSNNLDINSMYSKATVARLQYRLLRLPNPPYELLNKYSNAMWPLAYTLVTCCVCGRKLIMGQAYVYKGQVYCSECY